MSLSIMLLSIVEVVVSDTLSVVVMSLSLAATVDYVILTVFKRVATNSYFLLLELFNLLVGIQFLQFLHNSTFHLHQVAVFHSLLSLSLYQYNVGLV